MQKGRFAGIVKAEEQQLRVLVEQTKVGQDVPDCPGVSLRRIPTSPACNVPDAPSCWVRVITYTWQEGQKRW